ncbi:MAG: RES domain-containing protein [Verrucomicrobiae bacterium]|nr:RES domain-containing protein [Verrucomicrobiae bacterium]
MEAINFDVENARLLENVAESFSGHHWCKREYSILSPGDRLRSGWEKFKHVVQHLRRYTFWMDHSDYYGESEFHPDFLSPSMMLKELEAAIVSMDLVRTLPVGTEFWRLRIHSDMEPLGKAEDLTPPPIECAIQPNRMSPAGIPMFYGASDWETAFAEVVDSDDLVNQSVTGAAFSSIQEISVLDLVDIPDIPGFFAKSGHKHRHALAFLHYFTDDLSKPIERDRRPHIDYVPTQVFTEYIRFEFERAIETKIDGIIYSSSRNGGTCCVLFITKENCLPKNGPRGAEQIMEFVPSTLRLENTAK